MLIRVLGDIDVNDGNSLPLGGPTQRRVLAVLTARRGEIVTVAQLVDVCWPDGKAPDRAEHNVRTYVHRLRTTLGDRGDCVETVSAGYRLRLDRDELDLDRFADLAASAGRLADTGDLAALERIDEADTLWRGRPYCEFADEPWVEAEVARVTEMHWRMYEHRAEVQLLAGQPGEAATLLQSMIRDEPLRERPRALLMRALYESGRQAEALRAFQAFRRMLIDEVGVEPSSDLVELDRAIAGGVLDSSLARSRTVGNYELRERIGQGAFAVVHRAVQTSLGRDVAVKIVRAELADRPEFVRRFEAEAQMVAAIEHPSVVPLYDYWREPGQAFLVMRWMTGGSLEARLDDGPWSLDATVELVEQIAAALDAAHDHGVVHRDVKPANILFDGDGRAYLGDFGIALTATERATPQAALSEGSPVFASPEQLRREPAGPETDVHALAIVAFSVLTGRTPFANSPDEATLLRRQLSEPIPAVSSIRCDLPSRLDAVLATATAKRPEQRYPTATGFATAFRAAAQSDEPSASPPMPAVVERTNPYQGLRAFAETDTHRFHGRARLVDELLEHLRQPDQHLLAVVGPSGSGKSSVVRAGLVPALRDGRLPGSSDWFTTTMNPGRHPFEALEVALLRIAVGAPGPLLDQLRDGDRGVLRTVRRILPADAVAVVVIDQLEELFTAGATEAECDQFLRALAVAVTEPSSPVRVVLTLRADFYDQPLRHPTFAPLVKRSTIAVTPLAPDELEEAITCPAADVGVGFEPGLVAEIVADVNGRSGALPLLQYALTEAFDRSLGSTITLDDYREVGGLTGALAWQAEALYAAVPDGERVAIRRLFGRLVALGDGSDDTRRRLRRADLPSDSATDAAIDQLGTRRLLTFDRDPTTREPTIEIAHEAVIHQWPRLRSWLEEDRSVLRSHHQLAAAATAWVGAGRDPDELYVGARLASAEPLLVADTVTLNPTEEEFLRAGIARREADRARERARLRRLRRLVTATAAIAVVALVAGAIALVQRRRADEQAASADRSAALAEQRASESEAARLDAEIERQRAGDAAAHAAQEAAAAEVARADAEAARGTADLQRIRSRAVAEATEQPEVAALLAVEAARLDPGRDSDDVLHRVLTAIPGYRGHVPSFAFPAELATDGTTLTAAGPDTIDVWDLTTMTQLASVAHDATGADEVGATSPDGRRHVITGRLGTRVLDLTNGERVAAIDTNGALTMWSPDSTRIALAVDGPLQILDAGTLEVVDEYEPALAGVSPVDAAWSPYAEQMGVLYADGTIGLTDTVTGTARWLRSSDPAVAGVSGVLAFTPDGRRLIAALTEQLDGDGGHRGVIRTLDVADGVEVRPATETPYGFWQVTPIDARGDRIIGTAPGALGGVIAYDLEQGVEVASPAPNLGAIGVLYSPTLDVVMTWGNAGVHLWATDGSSPLERRITLPDPIATSAAARTRGAHVWVGPDGDVLRSFVAGVGVGDELDLASDPPRASAAPPGMRVAAGSYTLVIEGDEGWMEAPGDEPLGPPVTVPADTTGWAASPDGRFFALGRAGGAVDLFRADGSPLANLTIPGTTPGAATYPSFADDGSLVAAFIQGGSNVGAVWSTGTEELVVGEADPAHLRYVLSGDVLYANRLDLATIDRLDPATREQVGRPLVGHVHALIEVTTDAAHGLVATMTADRTVRLWDVATGRQFGRDVPAAGSGLQFVAEGAVLSVPNGNHVSLWNLDTSTWPELACRIAGRNLTRTEWDELGPRTIDYRPTCSQFPIDDN